MVDRLNIFLFLVKFFRLLKTDPPGGAGQEKEGQKHQYYDSTVFDHISLTPFNGQMNCNIFGTFIQLHLLPAGTGGKG
jgi:hypothetical protein